MANEDSQPGWLAVRETICNDTRLIALFTDIIPTQTLGDSMEQMMSHHMAEYKHILQVSRSKKQQLRIWLFR